MNEKFLISRTVLFGDRDAFGRLVEAYQSPVRRFLMNLTGGDEELGKDLAQETFIKAWLNIGSFRSMAKFSTWLFRIAYNTFYDHTRSRTFNSGTQPLETADRIRYKTADTDLQIDMARAMQVLTAEERASMLLFYMEDLSVENISRILDLPAGTVKSHLSRGRKKISAYLEPTAYNAERG